MFPGPISLSLDFQVFWVLSSLSPLFASDSLLSLHNCIKRMLTGDNDDGSVIVVVCCVDVAPMLFFIFLLLLLFPFPVKESSLLSDQYM